MASRLSSRVLRCCVHLPAPPHPRRRHRLWYADQPRGQPQSSSAATAIRPFSLHVQQLISSHRPSPARHQRLHDVTPRATAALNSSSFSTAATVPPQSVRSTASTVSSASPSTTASTPVSAATGSSSALSHPPSSRRRRYLAYAAAAIAVAVVVRGPEEVRVRAHHRLPATQRRCNAREQHSLTPSLSLSALHHCVAQTDLIIVSRFIRTALTFVTVAADFKWSWYQHPEGSARYRQETDALHQRTALRLLRLAQANRGLYIKSGQYISSMSHALPSAYIVTLRPLQNEAPSMPFHTVKLLLAEEFPSVPFSQLFASFSVTPVASASIAQVHRATLPDGTAVAVKVQHQSLRKEFASDLLAHLLVLRATELFFPRFHLSWIHDEIADNLTQELDFEHEGRNAEKGARKFAESGNSVVHVPRVYWERTSRRVLTMEWCDGVKVNDKPGLQRIGVRPADACRATMTALAEQCFLSGFVHCDPHPGNIFIRPTPPASSSSSSGSRRPFQVVIIDWGLCRQMRESVRLSYCRLWTALILRHDDEAKAAMRSLGLDTTGDDDSWELIAMSILMRPYRASSIGFANRITAQDMAALRHTLASKMDHWIDAFQQLPRELLLVLRNQNYTRALNYEMGQPVNRFRIMARTALQGQDWRNSAEDVRRDEEEHGSSWNALTVQQTAEEAAAEERRRSRRQSRLSGWLYRAYDRVEFEWSLLYADALQWFGQLLFRFWATDNVKRELNEMAKQAGEAGNTLFGG